ncbi:MAG: hypothetical protein JNL10_13700 [Verrucomicrobiales bacterium]|nr:hypothetical protein [Verrucomicrobiales bacterium]
MNALRWLLGLITACAGLGWLLLSFVGGRFRASLGASETPLLVVGVPVVVAGILLAGLVFPGQRGLLHAGAVVSVLILGVCLLNPAGLGGLGIVYFGLWLVFYFLAAWRPGAVD